MINWLRKLICPSSKEDEIANWWNNKWKQSPIIYKAREDKISFDVRNFITFEDCILQDILKKNKLIEMGNEEKTIWNIMRWVQENIKYISDSSQFGFNEHWDFPAEVLSRGKADCEGMTHLIVSLVENAGIPKYKIKACCGYVNYKDGKKAGGHSYPIYLRQDGEWIDLDPCFYASSQLIAERIPVKNNKIYGEIWFTFNSEKAWSQKSTEIKR